jgi:hypothetical protein
VLERNASKEMWLHRLQDVSVRYASTDVLDRNASKFKSLRRSKDISVRIASIDVSVRNACTDAFESNASDDVLSYHDISVRNVFKDDAVELHVKMCVCKKGIHNCV